MRKSCSLASALVVLLALGATPAFADAFEDAMAAYQRGDYETAFRLTKGLAERGDAVAQYQLGTMYLNGEGTRQNAAEATKWFRLAADQCDPRAQLSIGISY